MTKFIVAIALITLAGCSQFTPAQQQQLQQQVVASAVNLTNCNLSQISSTALAWQTQNPGKTPTGAQWASWAESTGFTCGSRYQIPAPTPAS